MGFQEYVDLMKGTYKNSFLRFKAVLKDKYIHRFFFGFMLFGTLLVFSIIRKGDPKIITRMFFNAFAASFIMFLIRDIYIMCFKSMKSIVGREDPKEVSFRRLFSELYKFYKPEWIPKKVIAIKEFFRDIDSKAASYKLYQYVRRIDINYVFWVILFLLAFF